MRTDARQHGLDLAHIKRTGARHAFERHVVHIARGHARHLRHALVGGGGGQQENQVHAVLAQRGGKVLALLWRVVHDQHAVHAGGRCVAHKRARAVLLVVAFHRVGVAHEHHGCGVVALAKAAHHGNDLGEANAGRQRAITGLLDHRAVGRRVGEGHAELDHVGTRLGHAVHEIGRDVRVRKTGGDEWDECLAVLLLQRCKGGVDAAHFFTSMVATPPLTDCPRQLGRQ
ncbi:hypothetical protein D9M68_725640 [compost metagenome]